MPASAATKTPGRRMARAARVEQLLNVAEVLFAEYGYDGTSIERIAKAAGTADHAKTPGSDTPCHCMSANATSGPSTAPRWSAPR